MKKWTIITLLAVLGIAAQSCGSGEKCPAYSQAPATEDARG